MSFKIEDNIIVCNESPKMTYIQFQDEFTWPENSQKLVDVLNAAEAVANNTSVLRDVEGMCNLRRALAAFKKEGP